MRGGGIGHVVRRCITLRWERRLIGPHYNCRQISGVLVVPCINGAIKSEVVQMGNFGS
jgi:hypothetical protein